MNCWDVPSSRLLLWTIKSPQESVLEQGASFKTFPTYGLKFFLSPESALIPFFSNLFQTVPILFPTFSGCRSHFLLTLCFLMITTSIVLTTDCSTDTDSCCISAVHVATSLTVYSVYLSSSGTWGDGVWARKTLSCAFPFRCNLIMREHFNEFFSISHLQLQNLHMLVFHIDLGTVACSAVVTFLWGRTSCLVALHWHRYWFTPYRSFLGQQVLANIVRNGSCTYNKHRPAWKKSLTMPIDNVGFSEKLSSVSGM